MKKILFSVSLILITSFSLISCSSDKKEDDGGFKVSKSETTQSTVPSKVPNTKQPCSLLNVSTAATLLNIVETKFNAPDVDNNDSQSRCKYGSLSENQDIFSVVNVYVYKSQSAYDRAKEANDGKKIETELDDAYSYVRANQREVEYFVAARQGNKRIAISASVALTSPEGTITKEQVNLPDLNKLATELGKIFASVK